MRPRVWLATLWLAALLGSLLAPAPSIVGAQEPELALEIDVDACAGALPPDRVREALRIELGETDDDVRAYLARERPRVHVRCESGALTFELVTPEGVVDRETVSIDRLGLVRFVAIAIAEGVAARARTEVARREPPPPPQQPAPPPEVAPAAPPVLALLAGVRVDGTPSVGVGPSLALALAISLAPWLVLEPSIDAAYARASSSLGDVERATTSGGLALRAGGSLDALRLEGGVAARGGPVIAWGTPGVDRVQGQTSVDGWLAVLAQLRAAWTVASPWRLVLDVEGGVTVLEPRAVGPEGVSVGLGLGYLVVRVGVGVAL